jgi:hypothetical protein
MPKNRNVKVVRKPRLFVDEWTILFSLRACLPRSEFPFVLRRVTGNLYRFADQGFVHLGPLRDVHDGHAATCLRVLKLFWARNDHAAIVAAHLHRTIGRGGVLRHRRINRRNLQAGIPIPPLVLLRGSATDWSNNVMYRAARRLKTAIPEYASYDATGQFLYKTISLPRLQIMFASRLNNNAELPMAVEILPERTRGQRVVVGRASP